MIETPALVLQTSPYSETSLIVQLLTREAGVVRAIAKGARRAGGRYAGVFEPYNRIDACLTVPDHDKLAPLGECVLAGRCDWMRRDLPRQAYAALGVEVIGRIAADAPLDPFFHDEAVAFLERLGAIKGPGSLLIALLIRLMYREGKPPHLGDQLAEAEAMPDPVQFDFETGAFDFPEAHAPSGSMLLPGDAVSAILGCLVAPPSLERPPAVPPRSGPPLLRWLMRVWEDHLGARLRSADFLEKMILLPPADSPAPPSQL
jgi:DNA repair protein RecO (recombination protein O)